MFDLFALVSPLNVYVELFAQWTLNSPVHMDAQYSSDFLKMDYALLDFMVQSGQISFKRALLILQVIECFNASDVICKALVRVRFPLWNPGRGTIGSTTKYNKFLNCLKVKTNQEMKKKACQRKKTV